MGKGRKASLGCLFWIAIILLAVVLFLFNKDKIMEVFHRFQNADGREPQITLTHPASVKEEQGSRHGGDAETAVASPTPSSSPVTALTREDEKKKEATTTSAPSTTVNPVPAGYKSRMSVIYFVSGDGKNMMGVKRRVIHQDKPLTETINTLLKGPGPNESNSSLITLVPKNTRLQEQYISIKGNTAILSFSEEFRYNQHGVPGLEAQIKQIVYTATEFSNVTSVQILINGKKVDYLAQEGVYIGAPLSRSSFGNR
jgi:spore germination protein GerM